MLRKLFCLFLLVIVAVTLAPKHAHAQTYSENVLYSFCAQTNCTDGYDPSTGLIQGADGNFYGGTAYGNTNDDGYPCDYDPGVIYKISPSGKFTTLNSLGSPYSLIQGGDGFFYGYSNCDGLIKMTSSGAVTVLQSGIGSSALIEGSDGNFYGTSYSGNVGSSNCSNSECGTVIKLLPNGAVSILYGFCSLANCADGWSPSGGVVEGSDGNLYGTTNAGGTNGYGTIFKLSKSGTLTTLYSFCSPSGCTEGYGTVGSLVEGPDGNFYGRTSTGSGQSLFGAAFKISASGAFATIAFTCLEGSGNECDESSPLGGAYQLYLGSDGNFYGIGGLQLFAMRPDGEISYVYAFPCDESPCSGGDGFAGGPLLGSDGNFYGAASYGGANSTNPCPYIEGCGVVYKVAKSESSALPAPVQVTLSEATPNPGYPVTLTWQALNAFSLTMQQCYLFSTTNGVTTPLGKLTGTMSDGVLNGYVVGNAGPAGVYTYAVTCGGVESGFAILRVGGAKAPTSTGFSVTTPVALGTTAKLTATTFTTQDLAPITGSVSFSSGRTVLGSQPVTGGSAALIVPVTNLAVGVYPVTATYSGDSNYLASSAASSITVLGYQTETVLNVSTTRLTQGQPVTLTASVVRADGSATPTGSVTFYEGTSALATVPLTNGFAVYTAATNGSITPGTYSLTAKYLGDTNDQSSTSTAFNLSVLAVTTTSLQTTPSSPVPANHTLTLTATVKQSYDSGVPTGTVSFASGTFQLGFGTLSNGTVSVYTTDTGLPAATYPITAAYSGDANNAASSATVNVVVQ